MSKKLKKLKLYFENGTTAYRIRPEKHILLYGFIQGIYSDLQKRYEMQKDKKKIELPTYSLKEEDWEKVKKELGRKTSDPSPIVVFYGDTRTTLFAIQEYIEDKSKTLDKMLSE